ncbi:MAG TPA: type IV pilus assembly protein PilM [Acidimicrobiales bacterium]|nr:type IV pilus assembly protein PilM [Acidimicrobiales bacterium]
METSIGLDIGSSAVRAAEIGIDKNQRRLCRYAQIGLPSGAVVDGEVVNPGVVTEALRRLWTEGGFSSRKVVLGVSGHRLIVRQADVPALNDEDLRSALRFDAQELIPIPMDDASFDFQVISRNEAVDGSDRPMMRILMAAAHKELLRGHLTALRAADLEAVAIDASPLALMRVVGESEPDSGVEALVAIGAELTTVAVRQGGVPRFIRSLGVGGSKLTVGIANAMHVDYGVAETLKRGGAPADSPQLVQARRAITHEMRDLGEDVRATMDFFVSQAEGAHIERLLVTGGASQTEGLVEQLAGGLDIELRRIDPFASLVIGDIGLDPNAMQCARASAATAVGLALWTAERPGSRMSLLPGEVAAAQKARRMALLAGAGVVGVAALLAFIGAGEAFAAHQARSQLHSAQQQASTLQSKVAQLQAQTAIHNQVASRARLASAALQGDVDWVRVINEVEAATPPGLSIQSLSGTRSTASGGATSAGSSGVGTLTFSVSGSGGLPAVAAWVDGLHGDHSLQGTWVSGITTTSNGGSVTFTSNSNLTTNAHSDRAKAVQP